MNDLTTTRPVRTRIKICGITRPEDGLDAARQGADAIGLVFYSRSSRVVGPERAREIVAALPPFVTTVGLFLDEQPERIRAIVEAVHLDMLQFHGGEAPAVCAAFGMPYIKAMPMGDRIEPCAFVERYAEARGFLLDSNRLGEAGGSGQMFDWSRYPRGIDVPLLLAGGLTTENVAEAVQRTRPWAVDVSSGVERAPGVKDAFKLSSFINEVRRGESD